MRGDAEKEPDSDIEPTNNFRNNSPVMDHSVGDGVVGDVIAVPAAGPRVEAASGQVSQPLVKRNRADLEEASADDDIEETIAERLWGLTEMFPEGVRNATSTLASVTGTAVSKAYSVSRTVVWVFFSSAAILAAPVILELERVNMDEMAKQQQREILLGPSAAMAGHK